MSTTLLVRTRTAGSGDLAAVQDLHERCSPRTLEQRFHAPTPRLPERVLRALVQPPGGWSVLAEQADLVVGHGCAGPLDESTVEVGLIVDDAFQGHGVGSRMMRDLADEATARGYRRLVCLTEPDNDSVARTIRRAGLSGVATYDDGTLEIAVSLPALGAGLEQPA